MKEIILLFSGGMDSTLLMILALQLGYKPYCLLFDYGQKHKVELEFAMKQCEKCQLIRQFAYEVVNLDLDVHSKLTDGTEPYKGVSPWHVPARNLIFISIAASIAESHGTDLVWYGANYEDREKLFPDCYQEWVFRLNQLLEINGSSKIKVEAPLLGMSKETIDKLRKSYNITDKEIFSGYGEQ